MGGKLFGFERIQREEYQKIEEELRNYLNKKIGEENYLIPRYYANKPDFGDVDILLLSEAIPRWDILRNEIADDLKVTNAKYTHGTFSVPYLQKIQVDFIPTKREIFHSMYQFLCFNDLGNILGKIFYRYNLKYGEKGLFYVYRRKDSNYKKDFLITTNLKEMLSFIDLSYEKWEKGFDSLEDMFDYVISSPYFTSRPFIKLSTRTGKRVKLRTTMKKFVEYIHDHSIDKEYDFNSDRSVYIPKIAAYFPDAKLEEFIELEKRSEERSAIISKKFNGKIVMDLFPELKNAPLGKFIKSFSSQFADFDSYLFDTSDEKIIEDIRSFHSDQIVSNINS